MTLVVEDGTGLANADSYISTAFADTYHASKGNLVWASYDTTTVKEPACRNATEYMVSLYRQMWGGYRTSQTQALDWPRTVCPKPDQINGFVYGRGGYGYGGIVYYLTTDIPAEVKAACADLALRAALGDLVPDLDQNVNSVAIASLKIEYDPNSSQLPSYPSINRKLAPLLSGRGQMTRVART